MGLTLIKSTFRALSAEWHDDYVAMTDDSVRTHYQICTRCVMDTSASEVSFDSRGRCQFCRRAESALAGRAPRKIREQRLLEVIRQIKQQGKGRDFDCVVGLSGGCDSSYLAFKVVEYGLRPLVVHFDSGWNTDLASANIERIISGLDLELHTVVCDWEEMRDLQRSFFKARVVNADVPQDHAFLAVLMQLTADEQVRYWVTGHDSYGSESILPRSWRGYTSTDWVNIQAIHEAMGGSPLSKYPHYGYFDYAIIEPYWRRRQRLQLFGYLDYDKMHAKEFLQKEFGWRDYAGKHNESVMTRFLQGYYQPQHLGFDKRRAHAASLVATGQMSRDAALAELSEPFYSPGALRVDKENVLRKLGFSEPEWDEIVSRPVRNALDFKNRDRAIRAYSDSRLRLGRLKRAVQARLSH